MQIELEGDLWVNVSDMPREDFLRLSERIQCKEVRRTFKWDKNGEVYLIFDKGDIKRFINSKMFGIDWLL